MYLFLIPLLLGFFFNSASAFTTFYSTHLGARNGWWVCIIFRDVFGIPLWALGYIMAARASSGTFFSPSMAISILGWLLILAGAGLIVAGLLVIGWRSAAPSVRDTLVVSGLYAHIRHPLYSGMLLELIGLFVLIPAPPMLVACTVGVIWVQVQARLEELDLVQRLPAYKEYCQHVPRFIPKLR